MISKRIALARICYGGFHHAAVGDWLARTCFKIVSRGDMALESFWVDRHNVCLARNLAVETARERKADLLLMVDADMAPDCMAGGQPFWDSSIRHALSINKPCVISAPALRSDGSVCVYHEVEDDDGVHLMLMQPEMVEDAAGIVEVPASSLALCLIDMRCFDALDKPFFRFGYTDASESEIAYGEEAFTVKCREAGFPVFCNWDSWCGHVKSKILGKPVPQTRRPPLWVPGLPNAAN